jgi:CHAD domain-containing protein
VVVPDLDERSPLSDVVAASIASGLTRMIRHDPGVRLGDDPEHVHQARVGTRRLRSDLRTFKTVVDPVWLARIGGELGWLAQALGEVRDADVLTDRLRAHVAELSEVDVKPAAALLRRLANQRNEARARLLQVLDSARYVDLLEALTKAAAHPPLAEPLRGAAPAEPAAQLREPLRGSPLAEPLRGATPAEPVRGAPLAELLRGAAPAELLRGSPLAEPLRGATLDEPAPQQRQPEQVPVAAGSVSSGLAPDLLPLDGPPSNGVAAPVPDANAPFPLATAPASDVLPALVRRLWRHLRQAVDALGDDPADEALHDVRIQAKRLRYAAEAAAPVMGPPARRLAAAVAVVQGALGDFNDAVVAEEWLRQAAKSGSPSAALVAGQLIATERLQQQAARDTWGKPWRRASARKLRGWLKS